MKRASLVISAVALLAASCGKPGNYTSEKSRACFAKSARVSGARDFVASTATGGAFVVRLSDNSVTVAFGDTLTDADNINQAYRRFSGKNIGVDDVLRQDRNAVMLWHEHPSDADIGVVQGCLK